MHDPAGWFRKTWFTRRRVRELKSAQNSVTVQNRTHVYINFFHHKDLGNHLLQLCPKVVKHPVYIYIYIYILNEWDSNCSTSSFKVAVMFLKITMWCETSAERNSSKELSRNICPPKISSVSIRIPETFTEFMVTNICHI